MDKWKTGKRTPCFVPTFDPTHTGKTHMNCTNSNLASERTKNRTENEGSPPTVPCVTCYGGEQECVSK